MNDGRKSRLLTSYAAGGLALAARIGQQLFLVSAFLYVWEAQLYQDWLLMTAAATFFGLLDFGARPFLHNSILMAWAAKDAARYRRIFRISIGLSLVVFGLAGILCVPVGMLVAALIDHSAISFTTAAVIFATMAIRAALDIPSELLGNAYWARREVARSLNISTAFVTAELGVVIAALLLGVPPVLLPLAYIAPKLAMIAFMGRDIHGRYKDLSFRPAVPTRAERRELLRHGLAFSAIPATQLASSQGVVLILGIVAPESLGVVVFTVLRTLAALPRMIVERMGGLTGAEMARSFAAHDQNSLMRLYENSGRLLGGLAGLLGALVWIFAPSFVPVWTSGEVYSDPAVLVSLLLALIVAVPGHPAVQLFSQVNKPERLLGIMFAQTATVLVLTAALGRAYGASGAALAVFGSELLAGVILLPLHAQRSFALPVATHIARTWVASAIGFAVSLPLADLAILAFGDDTIRDHFFAGSAWSLAVAIPACFVLINAQHRRWLFTRLRTRLS